MIRLVPWMMLLLMAICGSSPIVTAAETTFRLYDGVTAFVDNLDGREWQLQLDVRDINIYETGPREVLFKVYDPDGRAVVREVIPDDGVTSQAFQPAMGAWDHEAWYYTYGYQQGAEPMLRWSAFSQPDRLATVPKRTFQHTIPGGKKGVYKVLLVGCLDHYVTLKITPDLPTGFAGHCDFLYGRGPQHNRSFLYVPKGTTGLHFAALECDQPRSRQFKLTAPDGKVLVDANTTSSFTKAAVQFEQPGQYDDQILTLDISANPRDFAVCVKWRLEKDPEVKYRGERAVQAVFAPDATTANALKGGAIYHDGRVFWQPYQVRFHDWLKKLSAADFEVKTPDGQPADPAPTMKSPTKPKGLVSLPQQPNFLPLNGVHWQPPLSDHVMHHYAAHQNKAALNVALRDLAAGFRSIGPNDHMANVTGGPFANMAYEFGNYAFHYWRPAWRVLQQSDAPEDVKAIVREALLVCGDRLAFCRSWERVNGNAFAQLLSALRYCSAATGDPLQKELFDTYWDRFEKGGWGERVGVGASGPVQEGFAYAYHYGSYILNTWPSVLADFHDERFQRVYDRIRNWFSYTLADERIPAGPWSSRTHHVPEWSLEKEGPFAWKGLPGPDFTVAVNDANEFFAARRAGYYALTFHGRLSPKWNSNSHYGQSGYGGGMLCQLQIPGHGPVLISSLNGEYGDKMHVSEWRNFHLHTVVGRTADEKPLVAGDSEHFDAKLVDNVVTSSGEVRDSSIRTTRSYSFGANEIACELRLQETGYNDLLNLWLKDPKRGKLVEAYEMIPFVPKQKLTSGRKAEPTVVTTVAADGKPAAPLTTTGTLAAAVIIDRGGFGVRIEFDAPQFVLRGENNTLLIRLVEKPVSANGVTLRYRLVPFVN